MKILHVAETIKGGVATVLNQLVEDQIKRNSISTVDVLIPQNQLDYLSVSGFRNVKTFRRTGRNIKSFFLLATAFMKLTKLKKYDVIHIHSTFAGVIIRSIMIFSRKKPVVVYCPHAFSFVMKISPFKKEIYAFIEKFLAMFTDVIICVSQFEINTALSNGIDQKKLSLVYNGIPKCEISCDSTDEHKPYLVKDAEVALDEIKILFVGRFDYQKGVDILEKAILNISKMSGLNKLLKFNIVGGAVNDDVVDLFQSVIQHECLEVNLLGWLNKKELEKLYLESDVVVMPSRWEGFGLVVAESYQFGKPVIGSDNTALSEIIIDKETGFLFKTESVAELSNILFNLNLNKLKSMSQRCKSEYEVKYTSEKMSEKIIQIYEKILMT